MATAASLQVLAGAEGTPVPAPPPASGPSVMGFVYEREATAITWRVAQPFAALADQGYPCAWDYLTGETAWGPVLSGARRPDAVLIPRLPPLPFDAEAVEWVRTLKRFGIRFIYDCDDDYLSPGWDDAEWSAAWRAQFAAAGNPVRRTSWEVAHRGAVGLVRLCNGATAATPALAAAVRRLLPAGAPVVVVPNAIDAAHYENPYPPRTQLSVMARPPGLTVGWAGSIRLEREFTDSGLAEAWRRLARRYSPADLTFVVVAHPPAALLDAVPASRLVALPSTTYAAWPQALRWIDIGCLPLVDDWFNRAKSPQKAHELALCGAAVVASPTVYGDDPRFAECGGLLARGADEWEAHLRRLIEDARERRARQARLEAYVRDERSLAVNLHRWPAAWRTIASRRRANTPTTRPNKRKKKRTK